jgi:hypothetical protein
MTAKTIQIFLPDGEPQGVRVAEVTTRIVQALAFPRTHLKAALGRPEAQRVAFYLLFGQDEQSAKPLVYVGETTNVAQRFDGHNRDKDFWQSAVILTSRTETFTSSHGKYLEWLSIKSAKDCNRYLVDQKNQNKPHVTEPLEHELQEVFETAVVLLGALGFPVFEPLVKDSERKAADVFYCRGPDADASGQLVNDGFVVFKGSKGRRIGVPSAKRWRWLDTLRAPMIKQGILKEDGNHYVFTEDFLFHSPSAASVAVLGRTSNGWRDWKTAEGTTLHELKREGVPTKEGEPT